MVSIQFVPLQYKYTMNEITYYTSSSSSMQIIVWMLTNSIMHRYTRSLGVYPENLCTRGPFRHVRGVRGAEWDVMSCEGGKGEVWVVVATSFTNSPSEEGNNNLRPQNNICHQMFLNIEVSSLRGLEWRGSTRAPVFRGLEWRGSTIAPYLGVWNGGVPL